MAEARPPRSPLAIRAPLGPQAAALAGEHLIPHLRPERITICRTRLVILLASLRASCFRLLSRPSPRMRKSSLRTPLPRSWSLGRARRLGTTGRWSLARSEERRVGQEWISTIRYWWAPDHKKK